MLEIEIDGKQVSVEDGSTVMDAATRAGVYIPHFCYHKKLSIAASCRMCLVQVEKAPKPLPACATPVTNGMKVMTHSDAAVKAQKGVMEFLLINHPLDCPICDQGGECQLQDLAVGYGCGQSRYEEEKRVVVNKNLGPLVSTDMTRCIHCTRCVRFTQEIAGEMELGQAFRGEHAEIMPFIEKTVDSELSGNIIDLCPVGALTSKPFRFAARTWELARRKSVSPHDSLGSNLIVQVKHDAVKRVLPLENEAINECWLSDKDRFSYEGLNSEERLTNPMIKQCGQWKEVDWQAALEFVAAGLRSNVGAHGSAALGALASPHSTVEELYLLQKLIRALGSDNVDFRLRQADFRMDGATSGAPWLGMPIAEVGELDRLLVIGSFLRKDTPLLAQRVRQAAKKRGLQLSVVGASAEDWLMPVRHRVLRAPSAMPAALLEIAVALAAEKGVELSDELAALGTVTPSDEARAIARSLASGRMTAVWLGNQAVQSASATELRVLAQEIARLAGGRVGVIGEAANSVGGHLARAVPGANGLDAKRMIEEARKAYVLLHCEPDLDFVDPVATLAALDAAEFVVGLTAFRSEALMARAQVLLPVAPFAETSGTFVNCEGARQSFSAVTRPRGNTRPAWKVLRVLGNLLDLPGFEFNDSEAVAAEAFARVAGEGLGNEVSAVRLEGLPRPQGIERLADVPIHFADPLVRRASSLQRTRDAKAPVARAAAVTLEQAGLAGAVRARVRSECGCVELDVVADDRIAPGCVQVSAAHATTAALGPMCGNLTLERV
ncbi:MAG: NADH-quinone oxidoreductase subunit NuoG [Rhodocyclaceae bacterium]|nr:NADH-quinone oxidoreductase subunit NuoG [Rhodocyclaceae bacterium]